MRRPLPSAGVVGTLIATVSIGLASPAFAQSAKPTTPAPPRWELEVHGGWMLVSASNITSVETDDVPRSPTFTAINGFPSYHVSSWWLGDGANMVDTVGTALGTVNRIVRPPITSPLAKRSSGAALGARLTRHLTSRYDFEASFDYTATSIKLLEDAMTAMRAATDSYVPAWSAILSRTFLTASDVSASLDVAPGQSRDLLLSGAFNIYLTEAARWRPYVVFGGGLVSSVGDQPTVTLTGRQHLAFNAGSPTDEADVVRIRVAADRHAFAFVVGGGLRRETSRGLGVRADVRAHITRNPFATFVDALPQRTFVVQTTTSSTMATVTVPTLQLSNSQTDSSRSSFGEPFGGERRTFKGGGAIARVTLTTGVFWRF